MADEPAPTPAEMSAAAQVVQARMLLGGGSPPTAHNADASPDQAWVAYFDEKNQLQFKKNENYDPKAVKTTVYGSAETGYFTLDGTGNAVTVREPNADALVSAAVDRQGKEALRNERQANADAGKGYMTAQERATIEQNAARTGIDQATLNQRIAEFTATQRAADKRDEVAAATAQQSILESAARVGQIGAATEKTKVETGLLTGQTEAQIEEAKARTEQAKAATALSKQPKVLTAGVEGPTIYTQGPGGEITPTMRAGYVPKTMADIAARTGQINAAIQAKSQELQAKLSPTYTPEQADADYQKWYDQVVTPEQGTLQAATQEAQQALAKEQASQAVSAFTAANAAGTGAVQAYEATKGRQVGPRAAEIMQSSGPLSSIDWSGAFAPAKDPNELRQNAINETFARLFPQGAAGGAGQTAAAISPAQVLDATQWRPSAGAPAPAAGAGGVPAAVPAAAGPTPEQLAAQRLAGYQTEAATNQGGGFGGATPFQGINPGGMAALMAAQEAARQPPPAPAPAAAPAARAPARSPMPAPMVSAQAPVADWGAQATQAMNVGGWTDPTPWATQASQAMNIGGWGAQPNDYPYGPPNLPANVTYTPPPEPTPPSGWAGSSSRLPANYMQPGYRYNGVTGQWIPEDPNNWQLHPESILQNIGNYFAPR